MDNIKIAFSGSVKEHNLANEMGKEVIFEQSEQDE